MEPLKYHPFKLPNTEQEYTCASCWGDLREDNPNDVVAHEGEGHKHPIHGKCIKIWADIQQTCPTCTKKIDTDLLQSNYEFYKKNINKFFSYADARELTATICFSLMGSVLCKQNRALLLLPVLVGTTFGSLISGEDNLLSKTIGRIIPGRFFSSAHLKKEEWDDNIQHLSEKAHLYERNLKTFTVTSLITAMSIPVLFNHEESFAPYFLMTFNLVLLGFAYSLSTTELRKEERYFNGEVTPRLNSRDMLILETQINQLQRTINLKQEVLNKIPRAAMLKEMVHVTRKKFLSHPEVQEIFEKGFQSLEKNKNKLTEYHKFIKKLSTLNHHISYREIYHRALDLGLFSPDLLNEFEEKKFTFMKGFSRAFQNHLTHDYNNFRDGNWVPAKSHMFIGSLKTVCFCHQMEVIQPIKNRGIRNMLETHLQQRRHYPNPT